MILVKQLNAEGFGANDRARFYILVIPASTLPYLVVQGQLPHFRRFVSFFLLRSCGSASNMVSTKL